jgi:hypothetical protein
MSDGFDVDGVIGRAATPADAVGVPAEWARLRRPILGEADAVMDPAEARDLVGEFRRVRDRHRGAFVAPAAELHTDPVRIASFGVTSSRISSTSSRSWTIHRRTSRLRVDRASPASRRPRTR